MARELVIAEKISEPIVNIVLDTLERKKQALIFVNNKRSAEKVAEEISKKVKSAELNELKEQVLKVLSKPTKQCERLALCIKNGVAFHHAGLASKQKEIIEEAFKKGEVKIICCTPTLAAGVDLPAFRAIIRDVKRYSERKGMDYIPVLEYLQMAGRAGRPRFDEYGEAIIMSSTEGEKEFVHEKYILGEPEAIYSKLSVEPVLRTYLLSLISAKIVQTEKQIKEFFSKTFWAHQYKEIEELFGKIKRMLKLLADWGFIEFKDEKYRATYLGKRVAELYLDPLTADKLICSMKRAGLMKKIIPSALIHSVCNTLEMRPLLSVKTKEYDLIIEEANKLEGELIDLQPSMFEAEYEDWLDALKTALMLNDWMEEYDEEYLLEKYDVRPGELHNKIENADWLLYSCYEFARINQLQPLLKEISKARFRLKYGVKEELLALLRLEGIGRARARKLFKAGIKDLGGVKNASLELLNSALGKQLSISVKKQVGEETVTDKKLTEDFSEKV